MPSGFTGSTVYYNKDAESGTHPMVVPDVHNDGRTE